VTSERIPIGRLPEPRWTPRPAWFFPDVPQRAWLDGSLLIVDDRQCDLRTAWLIEVAALSGVGQLPQPVSWFKALTTFATARKWSCTALRAWQESSDEPVQLVLEIRRESPDVRWVLLTEEHLRLLAQIIRSRPEDPGDGSRKALSSLDVYAQFQKVRPDGSWDWSFRAGPQAQNRRAE
jgi:hypothetical protein